MLTDLSERIRTYTPILLFVLSFIGALLMYGVNDIRNKIDAVDSKMFNHLTNNTIHIPRETIVSKDEWVVYQSMRDKQMADMGKDLSEIKSLVIKCMELSKVK